MRVWYFHRGALGDSVLLWPRLRAEVRAGFEVTLVTDGEKARLAARALGVQGVDAEQPRFNALWRAGAAVEAVGGVARVAVAGGGGDVAGVWGENARRMFPGAAFEEIGRPSRALYGGADVGRDVPRRENRGGPVVLHVGAGAEEKRWPLARWAEVAAGLRAAGEVVLIAGEVERERLSAEERAAFASMGGRYLGSLAELAEVLKGARVVIGCDSGPAHLAAALGVATVALFGPTDPAVWAPIGPAVRVLAPARPCGMAWLEAGVVLDAAAAVMRG